MIYGLKKQLYFPGILPPSPFMTEIYIYHGIMLERAENIYKTRLLI